MGGETTQRPCLIFRRVFTIDQQDAFWLGSGEVSDDCANHGNAGRVITSKFVANAQDGQPDRLLGMVKPELIQFLRQRILP